MAKKHKTAVITSLADVPAGFVQISKLFPDIDIKKAKNYRRMLSDAHKHGQIRAVKFFRTTDDQKTGPVFVNPDEAMQFIGSRRQKSTAPQPVAKQSIAQSDDSREKLDRRIADLLMQNNELLAAILDHLREQASRTDRPQWHPSVEDEVEA